MQTKERAVGRDTEQGSGPGGAHEQGQRWPGPAGSVTPTRPGPWPLLPTWQMRTDQAHTSGACPQHVMGPTRPSSPADPADPAHPRAHSSPSPATGPLLCWDEVFLTGTTVVGDRDWPQGGGALPGQGSPLGGPWASQGSGDTKQGCREQGWGQARGHRADEWVAWVAGQGDRHRPGAGGVSACVCVCQQEWGPPPGSPGAVEGTAAVGQLSCLHRLTGFVRKEGREGRAFKWSLLPRNTGLRDEAWAGS